MYIPGVSPEMAEEIRNAMKRPEGTVKFDLIVEGIFDPSLGRRTILEIETGAIIFKVERDPDLNLHFIHSSPGTGTRTASVDLKPLKNGNMLTYFLIWSPQEIRLLVGNRGKPELHLLEGKGKTSCTRLQIGYDGETYLLGGDGVEVMGARIIKNGKQVIQPNAIETWKETITAIEILQTGKSDKGHIFDVVCANMAIEMLVTGFETYCERRFLELENEGISVDWDSIVRRFTSQGEREQKLQNKIEQDAASEGISPIRKFVESKRINFQNFNECKRAFNKGYGIKFGEVINNTFFEPIKIIIKFRHRIVHVSPLISILNQDRVPPEEPVFSNRQYVNDMIKIFDDFIRELHSATLKLRPEDGH